MSRVRKWGLVLGALVTAPTVLFGVICWHVARLIRDGALVPNHEEPDMDLVVQSVGDGRIALRVADKAARAANRTADPEDWRRDGVFGLVGPRGRARVNAIAELGDATAVRAFQPVSGRIDAGDWVRLVSYAYGGTPLSAHGIPFADVTYASEAGTFPAWHVEGDPRRWLIFVHGQNGNREEALRALPVWRALGFSVLVITYRNDEGAPSNPDGFMWFGLTEWRDLEGAARHALERGAETLVLVGYSMGGAIVTHFLYESELAAKVNGVVLDSPVLDFEAVLDFGGAQLGIPDCFVQGGKALARRRFRIDWKRMDCLARAQELRAPILLFHGAADPTVPIATSDALAGARFDIVEYVRSDAAAHVRSWNLNRQVYESRLRVFLHALKAQA